MTHLTPDKGFIPADWPDGEAEAIALAEEPRDAFPRLTSEHMALALSFFDDGAEPPF